MPNYLNIPKRMDEFIVRNTFIPFMSPEDRIIHVIIITKEVASESLEEKIAERVATHEKRCGMQVTFL
jgi:hypothetical protein